MIDMKDKDFMGFGLLSAKRPPPYSGGVVCVSQ